VGLPFGGNFQEDLFVLLLTADETVVDEFRTCVQFTVRVQVRQIGLQRQVKLPFLKI
jgi:hypothetical protein